MTQNPSSTKKTPAFRMTHSMQIDMSETQQSNARPCESCVRVSNYYAYVELTLRKRYYAPVAPLGL